MEADKYEVLEKIGHGSFGIIRKVRRKSDGHVLCRKEISYQQMSVKEREQLHAELQILKALRHPNIVAYHEKDHIKASSDLHIYMEYCEEGDLGRRIKDLKRTGQNADEDFVWSVFTQVVAGLYRCHYGEDPPEVGKHVMRLSKDAKPSGNKAAHDMILHRDLKPENIFLGADTSVKLGDFGLSKIIKSHDFASTYVGTPFYMSPEICAAEQYSLHSDIWALGCIMYELCAKEPPFNAKTHLELIQKIRLGKIRQLPAEYSPELQHWIGQCLRVNPLQRPDTVQLLNIPMVKLKRKELEVVSVAKALKQKEEQVLRRLRDADRQLANVSNEREMIRIEIDNAVRREWEVKARLEIDRQVQLQQDQLLQDFDAAVRRRVVEELKRSQQDEKATSSHVRSLTPELTDLPPVHMYPENQPEQTRSEEDVITSGHRMSDLSMESPLYGRTKSLKRSARTPFARVQTMFENSPADIAMAEASPAPIASLGLSPRRKSGKPSLLSRNIFSAAANGSSNSDRPSATDEEKSDERSDEDDDDADDVPTLPSPTRPKSGADPFKALASRRPAFLRQKTAPMQKMTSQPVLFGSERTSSGRSKDQPSGMPALHPKGTNTSSSSPHRRMSKLPSSTALTGDAGSPMRKAPPPPPMSPTRQPRPASRPRHDEYRTAAVLNSASAVQGRTLVELAQARVGGTSTRDFAAAAAAADDGVTRHGDDKAGGASAAVTMWDPERDEMPSPFLQRAGRGVLAGVHGGPGMRHLR